MYFSGNMLKFYEDATQTYMASAIVKYSTQSTADQDVVATLELSEGCNIIGEISHTFKENVTHTFKFTDANGIEQSVEAEVTWINKDQTSNRIKPASDILISLKDIIDLIVGNNK